MKLIEMEYVQAALPRNGLRQGRFSAIGGPQDADPFTEFCQLHGASSFRRGHMDKDPATEGGVFGWGSKKLLLESCFFTRYLPSSSPDTP